MRQLARHSRDKVTLHIDL